MYEAIILAGGFGTRLREAVPDLPKPMAPVSGKPFLAWQLEYLISAGFNRATLSIGYKAEIIKDYFGYNYKDIEIAYVEENFPLGTGGAIELALKKVDSERVFILNGDSLCEVNFDLLRKKTLESYHRSAVGIFVKLVEDTSRYGAVNIDTKSDQVLGFSEKSKKGPGYINAGIYDVPKHLFEKFKLSPPFSFESEILSHLKPDHLIAAQSGEFFIDIGIPSDYSKAQIQIPTWLNANLR